MRDEPSSPPVAPPVRWELAGPLLIAFGANIDPLTNLRAGLRSLDRKLGIARVSTVYRTKPVGDTAQPDYLNGVVLTRSTGGHSPLQLKSLLRGIEAERRRQRGPDPNAPRTLDLDIALLGGVVMGGPELVIPDPQIAERPWLALPLAELAPGLIHPVLGLTLAQLAQRFGPRPPGMVRDPRATALLGAMPGAGGPTTPGSGAVPDDPLPPGGDPWR